MANGTIAFDTLSTSGQISGTAVSVDTDYLAYGSAKSWAHIALGGASLPDSFNFSSIDDDGTGEYGLNYTNAMGSVNYSSNATVTYSHVSSSSAASLIFVESKATSSVEIDGGYTSSSGLFVSNDIETNASVTIQGDLA